MKKYDIDEYVDPVGRMPFREWLLSLKDTVARARLTARVDRASFGNFGDWKAIRGASGIFEMREHYGPGYRIIYSVLDQKISVAKQRLADYKKRKSDDEP